MCSSISSSKPTSTEAWSGNISKLSHTNSDKLKDDMILILSAMRVYAIVTRGNLEPLSLDVDYHHNYDGSKAKETKAACIISLSSSLIIWHIIIGVRYSYKMWNSLDSSLDIARSNIGKREILHQFCACRAKDVKHLKRYLPMLNIHRIPLVQCWSLILERHTTCAMTAAASYC